MDFQNNHLGISNFIQIEELLVDEILNTKATLSIHKEFLNFIIRIISCIIINIMLEFNSGIGSLFNYCSNSWELKSIGVNYSHCLLMDLVYLEFPILIIKIMETMLIVEHFKHWKWQVVDIFSFSCLCTFKFFLFFKDNIIDFL